MRVHIFKMQMPDVCLKRVALAPLFFIERFGPYFYGVTIISELFLRGCC